MAIHNATFWCKATDDGKTIARYFTFICVKYANIQGRIREVELNPVVNL